MKFERVMKIDDCGGDLTNKRAVYSMGLRLTCSAVLFVVLANSTCIPREAPPELVPLSIRALKMSATMVDHDVSDDLNAVLLEHRNAVSKFGFRAVIGVEVVQIAGEVSLRGNCI